MRLNVCIPSFECYIPTFIASFECTHTMNLGAFPKLQKAIVSSVMSVRLPFSRNDSAVTGRNLDLSIFRKSVEKIQVSRKPDSNKMLFT